MNRQSSTIAEKPHYEILDGLRGVAALMVLWYHFFEGFAKSPITQIVNHGYLSVDFFFILSGFVIGYAYDARWKSGLTTREFMKRRFFRLHPMVLAGILIGIIAFFIQGSVKWDGTKVGASSVLVNSVMNLFMIPAWPGSVFEIRGNGEMFPINGPNWSLFFEYIGSLLYALFVRRLSTKLLAILTAALGAGLAFFAITNMSGYGHIGVGWTLAENNLLGGFLRMMFSFSMGLLLSRIFKPAKIQNSFLICSLGIIILVAMPFVGSPDKLWQNALYDTICILLLFPSLVWLGASGINKSRHSKKICKFLGDISYPLYAVHYPSLYLFFAWIWAEGLAIADVWWVAIPIFAFNIGLAYLLLKVYDEPLRKRLSRLLK